MSVSKRKCNSCSKEDDLKCCAQCKLVDYCSVSCQTADWRAGHKLLCKQVPKAIKEAKEKIASFHLSQYSLRDIGNFWCTEAQAERGQILEEERAQDLCYDAMEMRDGSKDKLRKILEALQVFPLSTEGWGMLGSYYRCEVNQGRTKKCSLEALKCYEIAIECGIKLNPKWKNKKEDLSWGEIENRPYLRSLSGRAIALYDIGRTEDAIKQAKNLLKLNPSDNQGTRKLLVTWYLETENTEGCANLLRKYSDCIDTDLAYADVLLQFLLWKKDDAVEDDVKRALFVAIGQNTYVPELIVSNNIKEVNHQYISPGTIGDAESYADYSRRLWKKHTHAVQWITKQRDDGGKLPKEMDLITLLQSGATFQIKCKHTDLDGEDPKDAPLVGTQRRKKCIGRASPDFMWPRQLNQQHKISADIFVHHNIIRDERVIGRGDSGGWPYWRKTKYVDIKEVPFWKIILQFCENSANESESEDEEAIVRQPKKKNIIASIECLECGKKGKLCALCNEGVTFFCSKYCMNDKLIESGLDPEPLFFDLDSDTLKIYTSYENEIKHLDIDEALSIAADHMPNLKGVDIYIHQTFILQEPFFNRSDDRLQLSSPALLEFFSKVHTKLEAFALQVGDCCWDEMKKMTDNGRAFLPLGAMPNLKKLTLTGLGFDDMTILTASLNLELKFLRLVNMRTRSSRWCIPEAQVLVEKLSELAELVTLSIPDHSFEDDDLLTLLPYLKNLRNLDVSGRFGESYDIRHSMLTDKGLMAIAKYCPKLQSLDLSYNRKVTARGVEAVLMQCEDLVELEADNLGISAQNVVTLLSRSKNLRFYRYEGCQSHEEYLLQNAMRASKGKTIISSTFHGMYQVQLSSEFQKFRDESMEKLTKAYEQESCIDIYNRWDGLV